MATILQSLTIDFFKEQQKDIELFKPNEIYQFHFEEGISRPFCGTAYIRAKKRLYRSNYDVKGLRAVVTVVISEGKDGPQESRRYYGKVKTIRYQGTSKFVDDNDESHNLCLYAVDLVSPLEELVSRSHNRYFLNRTVPEMIQELVHHEKNADSAYPALYELNTKRLEDVDWLSEKNLLTEQYAQSDLDFLHLLMRTYGLNYLFSDNVKQASDNEAAKVGEPPLCLFFTHDDRFFAEEELKCEIAEIGSGTAYDEGALLVDNIEYRQSDDGDAADPVPGLQILSAKDDREALGKTIEAIARNNLQHSHALRKSSFICTAESTRVRLGMKISSGGIFAGVTSKFVVSEMTTDINKNNDVLHPFEVEIRGVEVVGNEWVPGSMAESDEAFAHHYALAAICDQDGNTAGNGKPSVSSGTGGTFANDWLYAKLEDGDQTVIFRNTAKNTSVKSSDLALGTRVMLSFDRGVFYLSGYLADDLSPKNGIAAMADVVIEKLDDTAEKQAVQAERERIYSNEELGSISFTQYATVEDYVTAELASGDSHITKLVKAKAEKDNKLGIYDTDYLTVKFNSADDRCKDTSKLGAYTNKGSYQEVCAAVYKAYASAKKDVCNAMKSYHDKVGKLTENPKSKEYRQKIENLQTQCEIAKKEQALKSAENDVKDMAARLVKYFGLTSDRVLLPILNVDSKGDLELHSKGELKISAKKITIDSEDAINITSGSSIGLAAKKTITQSVIYSSIALKEDGATISAPAGWNGEQLVNKNAGIDMFGSTLAVKSYGGIKLNARNVKIQGNDSLDLSGSMKAGLKLSWGNVKVTGATFKYESQSQFEMWKAWGEYVEQMAEDIGRWAIGKYSENKKALAFYNAGFRTAHNIFDYGVKLKNLKDKEPGTGYDLMDFIVSWACYALDVIETVLERIADYERGASANQTDPAKLPKFISQGDKKAILQVDEIKIYIGYLKTILWVSQSFAYIIYCRGQGFGNKATSMKLSPVDMNFKGKKMEVLAENEALFNGINVGDSLAAGRDAMAQLNQQQQAAAGQGNAGVAGAGGNPQPSNAGQPGPNANPSAGNGGQNAPAGSQQGAGSGI